MRISESVLITIFIKKCVYVKINIDFINVW